MRSFLLGVITALLIVAVIFLIAIWPRIEKIGIQTEATLSILQKAQITN